MDSTTLQQNDAETISASSKYLPGKHNLQCLCRPTRQDNKTLEIKFISFDPTTLYEFHDGSHVSCLLFYKVAVKFERATAQME